MLTTQSPDIYCSISSLQNWYFCSKSGNDF